MDVIINWVYGSSPDTIALLISIIFGLYQYRSQLRWQRMQASTDEIKSLFEKHANKTIRDIVTWERCFLHQLYPERSDYEQSLDTVTFKDLIDVINKTDDFGRYTLKEQRLAQYLDQFLSDLDVAGTKIEARLLNYRDLAPYLGYLMPVIGGYESGLWESEQGCDTTESVLVWSRQKAEFLRLLTDHINRWEYKGVIRLIKEDKRYRNM